MPNLVCLALLMGWYGGIALAEGFWSTLAAIFLPFWAWYVMVDKLVSLL